MGHVARTPEAPEIRITASASGRLDAILANACPEFSRARLQRLIAAGHVTVNGEPARKSGQVYEGDVLVLVVPETPHEAPPTNLNLPILFEDELLLAIDKPAGLPVHGAPGDTAPSVAGWMLERLGSLAAKFDVERPGIVHRLDKDTSGVLLLAKIPPAQAALSAAFEARTTRKTYLAITDGVPARERAVIDAAVARHPGDRTKMAIARNGRAARTEYETLAHDDEQALLLVHPETGRTHQIRVHLAAIGAPVRFDRVYGRPGEGRQLLHAWQLAIPHPNGGTVTITAPIPPDFAAALRAMHLGAPAAEYARPVSPTIDNPHSPIDNRTTSES